MTIKTFLKSALATDLLLGLIIGLLSIAILCSLGGCATDGASPSLSVPCAIEQPISFSAPRKASQVEAWLQGDELGARYDTPETVKEIRLHNAQIAVICHG